jgi:hypothetical protein
MTDTAPEHNAGAGATTRLINIDNGGTLTDVCVIAGDEVLYTKTLTTPFDLSSCLFDGLTKASAVVYGDSRLARLLQTTGWSPMERCRLIAAATSTTRPHHSSSPRSRATTSVEARDPSCRGTASGRARERRGRPRTGVLRPRRDRGDNHRCLLADGDPRSVDVPRRHPQARCGAQRQSRRGQLEAARVDRRR